MPHCAAFGCSFQLKGNKGSDLSLHSFPSDKKRRKEWENACGRIQLPKDPRLCSHHFSPDAFDAFSWQQLARDLTGAAGYKRRLKPNVLPTIFSHKDSKHPQIASEIRSKKRQRQKTLDALLLGCKQPAPTVAASEGEPWAMTLIMEEPDIPSVQSVQQSVSVQCSLSRTDAARHHRFCPTHASSPLWSSSFWFTFGVMSTFLTLRLGWNGCTEDMFISL